MLASQIYNRHFPGSLIIRHNNAVNFTVSFPFYIDCSRESNVFIVVNIDSKFNFCSDLCWLFLALFQILRFQVSHKPAKHKLASHKLASHKLAKHKLAKHKLAKHKQVRQATQIRTQ
jgi:hypothetical protein